MRICTTCKENKEDSCYHKDKTKPNGLYTICKQCIKNKHYSGENRIKKIAYVKQYAINNSEKVKENRKIYQKNIPAEKRAKQNREYRQRHKIEFNKKQLLYINKNKYRYAYRTVLFNFLKRSNLNKDNSTSLILGYNIENFKQRIEMNFKEGMNWNNHGKWHIDHKKPISKFKKGTPANIVNALCNLQPLWAEENLSKWNKFNLKTK